MARLRVRAQVRGFSLVELLVALVFTMVLMAGMANVFKASLSAFYTSGESTSSARRNRMSLDLLMDDLNTSCMYLTDLSNPPAVSTTCPPFYILPNMPITNAGADDPTTGDELYFYLDQPLAFEGKIAGAVGDKVTQRSAAELAFASAAPDTTKDNTFDIECDSATYAQQVLSTWSPAPPLGTGAGLIFIFKDSWETAYVSDTDKPKVTGTKVTLVAGASPSAKFTGVGSAGLPSRAKHLPTSGIVFIQPAQMVKYSIQILQLDPSKPNGIPCLVRDQGNYSTAGFVANTPQQVVAENVAGFKTYLSTNSGIDWAGLPGGVPATYTDFTKGWDEGIRAEIDTQLGTYGRPDVKSTRAFNHWFRLVPTLVRVDLTTRTATQRAEYAATLNASAYRLLTQSLIFVPKHSGLPMDNN